MENDVLGLLDNDSENIFDLKNIPKNKTKTDFVARRKPCKNFNEYEENFRRIQKEINEGKRKLITNNVLVLEIDNTGILKKKEFYNLDDMKDIKLVEATTKSGFNRNTFIYDFMSSMRQKVNDPLGQRAKKRKEINQR